MPARDVLQIGDVITRTSPLGCNVLHCPIAQCGAPDQNSAIRFILQGKTVHLRTRAAPRIA